MYVIPEKTGGNREENDQIDSGPKEDLELPLFQFTTIAKATNGFSFNNKLGEGGFGPVYKVNFSISSEIAKRKTKYLILCRR
jgi:hypothetical protein